LGKGEDLSEAIGAGLEAAEWGELGGEGIVELLGGETDGRGFAAVTDGGVELVPEDEEDEGGIQLQVKQEGGALGNGLDGPVGMFPMELEFEEGTELLDQGTVLMTPVVEVGLGRFEPEDGAVGKETAQGLPETFAVVGGKSAEQAGIGRSIHRFTRSKRSMRYWSL